MESWPVLAKVAFALTAIPTSLMAVKSVATVLLQDKMIYAGYFPPGSRRIAAKDLRLPADISCDEVRIPSLTGRPKLQTFIFEHLPKSATGLDLLYFQGNAGNVSVRVPHITQLMHGCGIKSVHYLHYRGYGESSGWASERGIKQDSQAFLNNAKNRNETAKFLGFGHSIGASVLLDLAAKNPDQFSGIILENPFLSIETMIDAIYPKWTIYPHLKRCLWNHWDNVKVARLIKCPVIVIVGGSDEIVPCEHGKLLSKHFEDERLIVLPGGMHDDTWRHAGYMDAVKKFISEKVQAK